MLFLGHRFASIGYPYFFACVDVLRELVRVAGWGGVGLSLSYALLLVWFEALGEVLPFNPARGIGLFLLVFVSLFVYMFIGRGKISQS